jgi:hypothetical protein
MPLPGASGWGGGVGKERACFLSGCLASPARVYGWCPQASLPHGDEEISLVFLLVGWGQETPGLSAEWGFLRCLLLSCHLAPHQPAACFFFLSLCQAGSCYVAQAGMHHHAQFWFSLISWIYSCTLVGRDKEKPHAVCSASEAPQAP